MPAQAFATPRRRVLTAASPQLTIQTSPARPPRRQVNTTNAEGDPGLEARPAAASELQAGVLFLRSNAGECGACSFYTPA